MIIMQCTKGPLIILANRNLSYQSVHLYIYKFWTYQSYNDTAISSTTKPKKLSSTDYNSQPLYLPLCLPHNDKAFSQVSRPAQPSNINKAVSQTTSLPVIKPACQSTVNNIARTILRSRTRETTRHETSDQVFLLWHEQHVHYQETKSQKPSFWDYSCFYHIPCCQLLHK